MNRRRTVVAYAAAGLVSLALALVISPDAPVIEGPEPLAFDPVLAAEIAGWGFLLWAGAFALGWAPDGESAGRAD